MTSRLNPTSEQDKYNIFLTNLLAKNLFESGSSLRQALTTEFPISPDYARKIISRAVDSYMIRSSSPLTFGKGQFVYLYREEELDVQKLKKICIVSRPPIFRLLKSIEDNDEIISYYEALKITASPQEASSTKVSTLSDILKVLSKLELIG